VTYDESSVLGVKMETASVTFLCTEGKRKEEKFG
jgi:hypothetical protein